MTNEFPRAFGNAACNPVEQRFVEGAGNYNAQRAVGGREAFSIHGLAELACEATQDANLDVACPQARSRQKMTRSQGQARSKGIAYSAHPAICCRTQQGTQNPGKQVGVFVTVDMRDGDARGLNLSNLGGGFFGDFTCGHAASNRTGGEREHAIAKVPGAGERKKLVWAKDRLAVGEHKMAADAEFRNSLCELNGICEGRT